MIIPTIFFEITDKCNLQCSFCCKSWRKYQSCTMSYNDLDTIIKISKKYSKISGGEPGIVKDKTFYYIEHEICPIGMNTNLSLCLAGCAHLAWMHSMMYCSTA